MENEKTQALMPQDSIIDLMEAIPKDSDLFMELANVRAQQLIAEDVAKSSLIPKEFVGQPANVALVLDIARRFQFSPLMVMQNSTVINDTLGLGAKLIIAMVNKSGVFTEPLDPQIVGGGTDRKCILEATFTESKVTRKWELSWADVVQAGWADKPAWNKQPKIMIRYRTIAQFAKLYCPDVIMGCSMKDELEDSEMIDANYTVTDVKTAAQPNRLKEFAETIKEKLDPPVEKKKDEPHHTPTEKKVTPIIAQKKAAKPPRENRTNKPIPPDEYQRLVYFLIDRKKIRVMPEAPMWINEEFSGEYDAKTLTYGQLARIRSRVEREKK